MHPDAGGRILKEDVSPVAPARRCGSGLRRLAVACRQNGPGCGFGAPGGGKPVCYLFGRQKIRFLRKYLAGIPVSSKKKGAPLPASSGGLMRFFEDDTKGFRVDPRIVAFMPVGLITISWVIDLFLR